MKPTWNRLRRARRAGSVIALFCVLSCASNPAPGALNEDLQVLDHIVRELRYHDTALRFLGQLRRESRGDANAEAMLAFTEVDIIKAAGRSEEALKLLAEVQKKYPNDPRATLGGLESILAEMQKVTDLHARAQSEADKSKAQAMRAEGTRIFEERVVKGFDALVADLDKRVAEAKSAAQKASAKVEKDSKGRPRLQPRSREQGEEILKRMSSLHLAELKRLQVYLSYARLLEAGAARTAVLEKGAQLADRYVTERSDFPAMQFEGQLTLGQLNYELGRHETAEEQLSLIYGVEPALEKPWPKQTADIYARLRLQAVLFGARSRNAAHAPRKAAELIKTHVYGLKDDPLDLAAAETRPDHRDLGVNVRLEYGISLAGSGQLKQGLDMILKVIETPDMPGTLVTDARKALGRLALQGSVQLRAKHYYEAALGLKSELRFEDAIVMFETALGALSARNAKEARELAPLCLTEIGDGHFRLGNHLEAALAYSEVCRYFPTAQRGLLSNAAKRFLSRTQAVIKAIGSAGSEHAGLAALEKEAKEYSEKYAGGTTVFEGLMGKAQRLEGDGKFEEAAATFFEVPAETKDGEKVPFYHLAQARGHRCVLSLWDQASPEARKGLEERLQAALEALEKTYPLALKAGDKLGAAIAAFARGQHLFNRDQMEQASGALMPFVTELADVTEYRCYGLAILIAAEARQGQPEQGAEHFKALYKLADCKDNQLTAFAAQSLADAFEARDNAKEAGRYMLIYAMHPSAKDEVAKPETLADLIARLLKGGWTKQAEKYIAILQQKGGAQDEGLQRQILYFDALRAKKEKQYDKAIALLTQYDETFQPRREDKYYEDAHALHELAECYLARQAKPSRDDLNKADEYFGEACAVMQLRAQRAKHLEKTFWEWMHAYFTKVIIRQGELGNRNAYLKIINFLEGQKESSMGGLKEKFLELEALARSRFQGTETRKK